jgi:hypothetical protein
MKLLSFARWAALDLLLIVKTAGAAITYSVTFIDPRNVHSVSYAAITAHVQAAGADWAGYLAGSGSIEVEVEFTTAHCPH